jgi:hypothetical protein
MSGLYCGFHHVLAIFENLDTSLEDTLLLRLLVWVEEDLKRWETEDEMKGP